MGQQWPQMDTDKHRFRADFRSLERRILNLIIDGVPEIGVYSPSSASVFICVHLCSSVAFEYCPIGARCNASELAKSKMAGAPFDGAQGRLRDGR